MIFIYWLFVFNFKGRQILRYNKQSVAVKQNYINNKKDQLKVVRNKPVRVLGLAPLKAIMLLMFMILMVSSLIYNKVILDKIGNEIIQYKKDYEEAISEKVRLEVEMESKVSLKKLEEMAREKNLSPVQDYQVEYIDFQKQDNIELLDLKHKNRVFIKKFLADILAYIK